MKLIYKKGLEWQKPVLTEQRAYELLRGFPLPHNVTYVAAPWATLLDTLEFGSSETAAKAQVYLDSVKNLRVTDGFTVCQHEKFHRFLPLFKEVGIRVLFASHMVNGSGYTTRGHYIEDLDSPYHLNGIRIENIFLHPVEVGEPSVNKDIFYSFVGSRGKNHISSIRDRIFSASPHPASVIIEREGWQFDLDVYQEQILNNPVSSVKKYINKEKSIFYRDILSRSRFSLCPSGTGPTSIRFLESLGSGAIPVIFSDNMMLPDFLGINWKECSVKVLEKDYDKLVAILQAISAEEERQLRRKGLEAYANCSGENFVNNIRDHYDKSSP